MLSFLCMWNFRKSEKHWMQRYGPKIKYAPKLGFPPICEPQSFFQSQSLSLLHPCGAITWCKNWKKRSLRYLKTDHRRTHGPKDSGDYIGLLQINRGLKYNLICRNKACFAILAQVLFVKTSFSLMCYWLMICRYVNTWAKRKERPLIIDWSVYKHIWNKNSGHMP